MDNISIDALIVAVTVGVNLVSPYIVITKSLSTLKTIFLLNVWF